MNDTLGKRIERIRLELGLNKTEFGRLFNTTGSLVKKWENDQVIPNESRLLAIADLKSWSVEELLHGTYDERFIKLKIEKVLKYFDYEADESKIDEIIEEAIGIYNKNKELYHFDYIQTGYANIEEISAVAQAFKKLGVKSEISSTVIELALLLGYVEKIVNDKITLSVLYSNVDVSSEDISRIENVFKSIYSELWDYSKNVSNDPNNQFNVLFKSASDYLLGELDLLDIERNI
ncbi:helix-turn-helix domain-containing protein [Aerococcus sp.]|uniref:helix-turn-helix domain-containing protein n=1 Tax=Aerococcus sp. TaxID=1872398 RepID=UPI0025B96D58|nr:helix-turn-helix domain-containing protein [Aerococcus sp.]MBR2130362.1 helix-turn-helix domain-containing protein [Aerococcus sp.]